MEYRAFGASDFEVSTEVTCSSGGAIRARYATARGGDVTLSDAAFERLTDATADLTETFRPESGSVEFELAMPVGRSERSKSPCGPVGSCRFCDESERRRPVDDASA